MKKRKLKSVFNLLCEFINTIPVGTFYTVKSAREYVNKRAIELKFNPLWRQRSIMSSYQKGLSYPVGCHHVRLLTTKCIKRVKRGTYEVIGHIPDFVTMTTCEANHGYTRRVNDKWVLRGKKWKLGDPEPLKEVKPKKIVDKIETEVKPKLIILGQIEGCLRTKSINEAVIAMAEGLGPVHILEIMLENRDMIQVSTKGLIDYVEIIKLKDIRIVGEREYRKVLYPERDIIKMRDFGPRGLQPDSYKSESHLAFFKGTDVLEQSVEVDKIIKEAQIVSILKEGLSAVDAAKKIMKLL